MHPDHRQELKNGVLRGLLCVVLAGVLLVLLNWSKAAAADELKLLDRSSMLFPYYEAHEVLNSVRTHHFAVHTADLVNDLKVLEQVHSRYCRADENLAALQAQYSKTYSTWLELSAVVVGPLLDNNTIRQIDFRPLRINLLERAIQKQPKGAEGMALVGSPAKGFPALEHLLFQSTYPPASAQCAYRQEVVNDIARTVGELKWPPVAADTPPESVSANMALYFNQLVGAVHQLGWERMEKPLLKNRDAQAAGEAVARPLSKMGLTEQMWLAQWNSIRNLLVLTDATVPQAERGKVPLEAYLRGLGQIELADNLVKHSDAVNTAMPASVEESIRALKALKGFLEQQVAKGLKVSIQFSSSDGD